MLKEHHRLGLQPGEGHPEWQGRHPPFRGKVVGMLNASPAPWVACVRKATWAPCSPTWNAGWRPRRLPSDLAGSAFDESGALVQQAHRDRVRAVVDQVLWAAERLQSTGRVSISSQNRLWRLSNKRQQLSK